MAAIGTTSLYWDGTYTLKSDGSWKTRQGNVIGTTNSNTVKQVVRYHFTIPSSFNSTPVTIIKKIGFFIGVKTNGTTATNNSVGWGMAQGSDFGMKFFISSSSTLAWANLSSGIGSFNNADMNDGSQMPMTSSVSNTGTPVPSPTQYSVSTFNLKPGKTYYLYIFAPLSPNTSGSQRYWKTHKGTLEFTYETYTRCSKPTKITICRSAYPTDSSTQINAIFKPTDTVYIRVQGGSSGTENSMEGYMLYWGVGFDPTTTNYTGCKSTATINNATFAINFSSIARNTKIYFRATTLGAVAGYDSVISSVYCTSTINSLPGAPTIYYNDGVSTTTLSTNIVKSSQDKITLMTSSSVGSDTNSSYQTLQIQYRDSNSSSYTTWDLSAQEDIALGSQGTEKTFYFYTWDGLERSSAYKTITIERNSKPSLTVQDDTNSNNNYYSEHLPNRNYTVTPAVKVTPDINGQQNDNQKYKYVLYDEANTVEISTGYISNDTYTFSNIRKTLVPKYDSNQNYRIKVIRNDGIEDSDPVELTSETWVIPKLPIIVIYSNMVNDSFINPTSGRLYFDDKVRLTFSKDTGYDWEKMKYDRLDDGYPLFTIDTSNWANGIVFTYTLEFIDHSGNSLISHTYSPPLQKIDKISNALLSNGDTIPFEFGYNTYRVYIDGSKGEETTINFYNFISKGVGITDELLMPYGLTTLSKISYYLIRNNDKITNEMSIEINALEGKDTETLSIPVIFYKENGQESQDSIYYNLKSDYKNRNDTFDAQILFEIKNVFGNDILFTEDVIGAKSKSFTMTYEVEPIIEELKLFTQKENSSDRIELGQMANYYLKEKSQLWIRLEISTYNSNPEFQLISVNSKNLLENPYDTISFTGSEKPSPGNPIIYTYEGLISTFIPISEDYENYFKVNIKTKATNASLKDFYYGWTSETETQIEKNKILVYNKKHTSPSASISNSNYDEKTKTISLEATLQSNGFSQTISPAFSGIKVELLFREPDSSYDNTTAIKIIEKNPADKNEDFTLGLLSCNYDMKQISSGYIKLKITTYLRDSKGWFESAYFVETNEISVFNINPTVAYRKNYLGINTRDFSVTIDKEEKNDGVVYISNTEDRPCIYLKSSEGSIRIINIITGEMDGFVLEGGTW